MALELSFSYSMGIFKPSIMSAPIGRSVANAQFTMTGNFFSEGSILVATSPGTAIPLGQVTEPHWCYFNNLDPTNYVTISSTEATFGSPFLILYPGESCWAPVSPVAVPWALANTASIQMEYLIVSL